LRRRRVLVADSAQERRHARARADADRDEILEEVESGEWRVESQLRVGVES
jgi:hypothetical protein